MNNTQHIGYGRKKHFSSRNVFVLSVSSVVTYPLADGLLFRCFMLHMVFGSIIPRCFEHDDRHMVIICSFGNRATPSHH